MMCTNKSNNVKLNNSLKGALHKMDMIKDIKGFFKKGTNYQYQPKNKNYFTGKKCMDD